MEWTSFPYSNYKERNNVKPENKWRYTITYIGWNYMNEDKSEVSNLESKKIDYNMFVKNQLKG